MADAVEIERWLVAFGRRLRSAGIQVDAVRLQTALRALAAVDLADAEQVYWALRCAFVSSREHGVVFDRVLAQHREPMSVAPCAAGEGAGRVSADAPGGALDLVTTDEQEGTDQAPQTVRAGLRASEDERLRGLEFSRYSEDDLRAARRLIERLGRSLPRRQTRRAEPTRSRHALDVRRTLQDAIRSDGMPLRRAWQRPGLTERRTVLLLDVSGSMASYSRPLMMFAQAAVRASRRIEVFTFGTRLTRVTADLARWDADEAIGAAGRHVRDWSGGTRIGQSLLAFNDIWGRRGLARGAAVIILSDGWERGDVALLRHEMERLRRSTHTVIWVNPLAGDPDYQPLAAGMAAVLPWLDVLVAGHNLAALEALARMLEALPSRRGDFAGHRWEPTRPGSPGGGAGPSARAA